MEIAGSAPVGSAKTLFQQNIIVIDKDSKCVLFEEQNAYSRFIGDNLVSVFVTRKSLSVLCIIGL